jgi:NADP-dependent 3-hydroxy acid dehydrogenase YdfG
VDALSKGMRIELVEFGIKVTNIAPGAAETEFSLVRFKGDKNTADSIYQGFDPLQAHDIAETIYFAATRPKHVTLNDIVIMPTAQANSTIFNKKG